MTDLGSSGFAEGDSARFQIEEEIARGGMGIVFKARDPEGKPVAFKRMIGDIAPDRFRREAELLRRLDHPNVVRYVSHGEDAEGLWLAMEWVEGSTLERALAERAWTRAERVCVAAGIASAVAASHAAGIIHRDIKPANVFVTTDVPAKVKLGDFGVARPADVEVVLTAPGVFIGTPVYMAPEQLRGEPATYSSDVYALATVVFETIAGKPPLVAETALASIGRILLEMAPSIATVWRAAPERLVTVVDGGLSKRTLRRPTAELMETALTAAAASLTSGDTIVSVSARGWVDPTEERASAAAVLVRGVDDGAVAAIIAKAAAHERIRDGTIFALFVDEIAPDASLWRAASLGLELCHHHPAACVRLGAGRTDTARVGAVGEAFERASDPELPADAPGLRCNRATAARLRGRFELEGDGACIRIVGDAGPATTARGRGGGSIIGRDAELAQLEALVSSVDDIGAPRVALVTAPPGSGKSKLADEIAARHEAKGYPPAFVVRFDPGSEGTPLGGLTRAARNAAGIPLGAPAQEVRGALASLVAESRLGSVEASAIERLLCGEGGGEAAPEALRAGLEKAVATLLRRVTARGPALVILQDAQWADRTTLALAEAITHTPDLAVAVLAFGRTELADVHPRLFEHRSPLRIELSPLAPRSATRLVASLLPSDAPAEVIERIVALGGGNPLVLEELARSFTETGEITATDSAMSVFEARIARLAPVERTLLRAAAVVGEVFWDDAVAKALGTELEDIQPLFEVLTEKNVLVSHDTSRFRGARELAFRHALLRDAAEASATPNALAVMHARVAEWLVNEGELDWAVVERHARLGGLFTLAGELAARAGFAARLALDSPGAKEMLDRSLKLLPKGHALSERVHLALEQLERELGNFRARLRHIAAYRRIGRRLGSVQHEALAKARWARLLHDREEVARAAPIALEAAELARTASPEIFAEAATIANSITPNAGQSAAGLALMDAALAHPEALSVHVLGHALHSRAVTLRRMGRSDEAIRDYERALGLHDAYGPSLLVAATLNALAYALMAGSRLGEARERVKASIELRSRARAPFAIAKTMVNHAHILMTAGQLDEAGDLLAEVRRLFEQRDDKQGAVDAYILEGRLAHLRDELDVGLGFVESAREMAHASGSRYDQAYANLVLGWLREAKGELEAARAAHQRAVVAAAGGVCTAVEVAALASLARAEARGGSRDAKVTIDRATRAASVLGQSEWMAETLTALVEARAALGLVRGGRELEDLVPSFLQTTPRRIGALDMIDTFSARPEVRKLRAFVGRLDTRRG